MVRLLLEDVTLLKTDEVMAQIRFRGGAMHTLRLPLPLSAPELRKTQPAVVAEIDHLLDEHTDLEIAEILNTRGLRPGVADRFSKIIIYHIRQKYGLEDRFGRLRRQGMLTLQEMAAACGLHWSTVKERGARGQLVSYVYNYNDRGERLYAPPGKPTMIACKHCGKPIPEHGKHGQWQKYCSVRCCMAAAHHRRRAARIALRLANAHSAMASPLIQPTRSS
jgi:predicted nucleic acid-binding Zn ribbon protein